MDYDRVAARYQQGRDLPKDVLVRWGEAVRPYLRAGRLRVADVGAGTGIFAAAWPQWAPATVLAVEPSAAMARARADRSVCYVQGVAEALPLPTARIDVVWLSTALHHFVDLDRSIAECARVLKAGGRVLVRTYAPDRTEITWANEFPGQSRWQARFHRADQLVAAFGAWGFEVVDIREVAEWTETYAESARWVSHMRHADSMLTALNDEEIAQGLATLRAQPTKLGRLELTLFVFARP